MKNDLLNALLMISIISPACNTAAVNILITKTHAEFQDKKCQKKPCSFQSVIKSKSMGMHASFYMKRFHIFFFQKRKLPLLYQVLKLKFPNMNQPQTQLYRTLIVKLIWTTLFVMQAMIFNGVKDFCYSSLYVHKSLPAFLVLYFVPYSDNLKDHNYFNSFKTEAVIIQKPVH